MTYVHTYCAAHLNKLIFHKESDAHTYMNWVNPARKYEVYPCPRVKTHFHIRDTYKRRARNKRGERNG